MTFIKEEDNNRSTNDDSPEKTCRLYAVVYKAPTVFDFRTSSFLDCEYQVVDIVPPHYGKTYPWHLCFSEEQAEIAFITESPARLYIGDPCVNSIPQWRCSDIPLHNIKGAVKGQEIALHYVSCKYCLLSIEPLLAESFGDEALYIYLQLWDINALELLEEGKICKNIQQFNRKSSFAIYARDLYFVILYKGSCFAFATTAGEEQSPLHIMSEPIWQVPARNENEIGQYTCIFVKSATLSLSAFRLPQATMHSHMSLFDVGIDVLEVEPHQRTNRCLVCCLHEDNLCIYDVLANTCLARINNVEGAIRSVMATCNLSAVLILTRGEINQLHYFDIEHECALSSQACFSHFFPRLPICAFLSPCGNTTLVTNGHDMKTFGLDSMRPNILKAFSVRKALQFIRSLHYSPSQIMTE